MTRVAIHPEMFRWARERAGLDSFALAARFKRLEAWEAGEVQPTVRQLEDYARATHAPVGYFFLPEPPVEVLPIPDFRTVANRAIARPSLNLLDMVYACQQRQDWYRDHARVTGQEPLGFVGSMTRAMPPVEAAAHLRQILGFSVETRRACPTWAEALRMFIEQADRAGVMVMVSGVVLNNNTRHLDPQEFRGFALSDEWAPLVFINGADSKAAQMFTLAHELAHIGLGQSALSDVSAEVVSDNATEVWCNKVAAELLVPMASFLDELIVDETIADTLKRLARHFKVSSLVILRRLLDAGRIDRNTFFAAYHEELARLREFEVRGTGGGDFYRTTAARVSKRFARALVESTLEGRTLFRDAFHMLGIAKTSTFNELGRSLGYPA
ncbi:MAG: ImmA/IrrE family metallo-endopeptidase [Xanthomonadaceae bacterium]|nr:ImmA/IrrE family metallo-endopeptidase [Xanthomonadaceae bacterium]MDP2186120.1 ImmA/IrrE family metallo-endopeptidase [Xanthomonadales bacterium]MDZ4114675.1 ImmA/IrrE family metallo-endopeptidase [Xanthomonadaceae bacterium]MDZ4379692.1 ImmA/IrrE family metallo-endopeptidase [Xanthomonadaceae bacterium]